MANCKGNDIKLKARIYVLFLLKEQKLQYLNMFLAIILVGWIGGKCYLFKEVFCFSGLCTENEPKDKTPKHRLRPPVRAVSHRQGMQKHRSANPNSNLKRRYLQRYCVRAFNVFCATMAPLEKVEFENTVKFGVYTINRSM